MADTPIALDADELLNDFAVENAKLSRRAVLAEAGSKARDKVIANLEHQIAKLTEKLEAQEALLTEDTEPEDAEPHVCTDECKDELGLEHF